MEPEITAVQPVPSKPNRRREQEASRNRPVVHGIVQYLGHRPDPKHDRKRVARLIRQARRRR